MSVITFTCMRHKQDCNKLFTVFSANEHFFSLLRKLYVVLYLQKCWHHTKWRLGQLRCELEIISSLPLSHNYSWFSCDVIIFQNKKITFPSEVLVSSDKYRILRGKCARAVFTHELGCIRNRTSERSERVRFLIQNNECVNTVQSTFHVVLCLLYKKGKSSNKIQNL